MDEQRQAAAEEEPGYGIGAVARRLGVPAPTLRTWNLRYGVGPSRRSPGGHRRYDARDLWRLQEMNRLIKNGVPAADAAREVLRIQVIPAPAAPENGRPAVAAEPAEPLPEAAHRPVIPTVDMLARAAVTLDSRSVSDWIGAALARHGVLWTWEELVLPVFEVIVRRQVESGASIEVEHLFSDRVMAALIRCAERPAHPINVSPVLLACAEDEQHSLPLHTLAAVLATEHRVETRLLGARTPYSALADAMRRLGPSVVFVWSQQVSTGDPAPLLSLPALRPPSRIVAGGPGWWEGLPQPIPHVTTFQNALTRILSALR
ncbi:DNA-binding transcriptional MerR regulator [Streptosporangium becharense]|uniref:DNA-binding transcriptional MerR regulator n=1 Tax=Streptosporangium becharense TaxID=1816182 RepID=A0A7W9IEQ4_9ACTN|nr:MerR family transcriptional regulator [Streptosporangium becharense]MBB2909894.1 DNA-binding transcriptional MerR regulator [Streptosporangium becharense]MBB5819151.1 DNA-binding transcriptional MerR regulator [Streptosporangium becharense]